MTLPVTSVLWKDYVDDGAVQESDFNVATSEIDPAKLRDGEVLVELLYLSVDPYMRGRMRPMKSYYWVGPFESGKPLSSGGIGLVKASKAVGFAVGDVVSGMLPWSSYAVLDEAEKGVLMLEKLDPSLLGKVPLSYFLGILGVPGMSAWASIKKIAEPIKQGEVAFVSGAAGAVGLVAGQLLKNIYGCKVIGSAGSDDKVALLKQLGFDESFNYKTTNTAEALKAAAPDGIDIYFDNVGGPTLETVLDHARAHARIVVCGMISQYDLPAEKQYGVKNLLNLVTKRIKIEGFIVSDWMQDIGAEFTSTMAQHVQQGKVKAREQTTQDIQNAGRAFVEMMAGGNTGKAVVKVAAEDPFPVEQ